MSQQEKRVDDVLLAYVQNVHRVSEKAGELAQKQHEHTLFLKNLVTRIGQARRSMIFGQGYSH